MEWHKVRMQQLDIAKELIALQRETMVKQANLTTMAQPHVTRDTTVSMLDSAVAQEANEWNNTQAALVDEAIAAVTKQVCTLLTVVFHHN
jgi:predicted component of type VI protein secretion system